MAQIFDSLKLMFESGNYELAILLAEGQNVDLQDLNIDFNKIARWKEFNYHASVQIAEGYELSVAAGVGCKATKSSHGYSSFEIAIITKNPLLLDVIDAMGLPCSRQENYGESMYIFNYMTNKNIIKIIKIIRSHAAVQIYG
jgi:hypothetical protein